MFSTDDEDMSFDSSQSESNHSGVLLNKDIGGPYHVEFVKPWKPVIVVYIDAIFAITYFTVVVLHYWTQIGINAEIHEIFNFIPHRILAFMTILTLKFCADLVAL